MSTDTGKQETEEFLPRARMRVKLEYADTMEEGALWEELERRYNAHDDLVEALRDSVDVLVGHTYASVVKQAYEKAIAALAKAEGA
jgi:hypothetical protein